MIKELVISIIIIILIFMGNIITENYTAKCVKEMSEILTNLREEIIKNDEEINSNLAKEKTYNIYKEWNKKQEKLAFYIEHDELEKVKTSLTSLKGYIDKDEYADSVSDLDQSIYILEHIKDKTALNLKNIF